MNALKSENVLINLPLFKLCGLYRILDQNRRQYDFNVFHCNVYGLAVVAIAFILMVVSLVTFLNIFVEYQIDNFIESDYELIQLLLFYTTMLRAIVIAFTFVFNAKKICESFDVTHIDDNLLARICRKYVRILWKYRGTANMIFKYFKVILNTGLIFYWTYPLMFKLYSSDDASQRKTNIFKLPYPINTHFYNEYYPIFYVTEMMMSFLTYFSFMIFNFYFISFCYIFIAQYEVISLAYEDVGNDNICDPMQIDQGHHENNCFDDLISIFIDHQRLDLNLKLYYSIIWNIIVLSVVTNSSGIIYTSFSLVVIITSPEKFSNFNFIRILVPLITLIYMIFDLFFICYLLERINIKKETAESSIYNCNWTDKSLKFQKLMLLAMKMQNANKIMVNITPNKIVNLQLFCSVISTSYNITSVLLKSRSDASSK